MDLTLERDGGCSALGSLFQQIINDMKNTSPIWEDFVAKASKLHACLRAAIQAIAAYLDAFQKIADAATNSRGASKEIGTALTRVCLRHKAVETRLKTFTTAIMDCLVQPLQDKLEDWKRSVATIDKEHAKEYKRCRTELKKRSTDTLRLQKKARKGQSDTIQSLMDSHMQDVTLRRAELEEVEKKSLRCAMIEERTRYCTFVHMLQPVVREECEVMSELGHLQEAMQSIANVTKDPTVLPQASEELIHDAKATMSLYPESPVGGSGSQGGCSTSLGSRKSSVCSISSMNSSGSSNSPGHHHYPRSLSQLISPAIRLKPGESSDSGFCSSPALTTQASAATSQSHAAATWPPHSQDAVALPSSADRPHTISSAYEKGHQRPPLTVYTFQNPETILEGGPNGSAGPNSGNNSGQNTPITQKSPAASLNRPPLPVRCSSLERPLSANSNRNGNNIMQRQCPSPIPAHITKELSAHHAQQQHHLQTQQQMQTPPTYVNMSELANMAALKITNQQQQQQLDQSQTQPQLQQQHSVDSISSQFSSDSIGSNQPHSQQYQQANTSTTHSHSANTSSSASSNTSSLHSHPSIESTVNTSLIGQTPTPSSGSSTPQNHYSPLLTNSPSSTAAGTPSGSSVASGITSGFVCNITSPTPPQSATINTNTTTDVLKITEGDGVQNITPTNDNSNTNTNTTPTPNSIDIVNSSQNSNSNSVNDTDSPTIVENDERSRASVLQKASMFEKQAAAAASTPPLSRTQIDTASIYGTRRSEEFHHRSTPTMLQNNQQQQHYQAVQQQQQAGHGAHTIEQQEVDKSFEDSIQELNNLIGELDSFQREIDASKQQENSSNSNIKSQTGVNNIDPFSVTNSGNHLVYEAATIISEQQQQQKLQQYCPSSNQTNSSGCGTDISDTTSDEYIAETRSLTSLNYGNNNNNNSCIEGNAVGDNNLLISCNYNSDSELSRCYVSDTSSLTGGCVGGDGGSGNGGYENPTFAHFATATTTLAAADNVDESICNSRTMLAADSVSLTSDSLSMQHRHLYVDNASDGSGSAVVVIYDHQIPITPDIDYVKQNSEIVVLRTKDPQQQRQDVRELQQLPANITGSPESPTSPTHTTHTATVAPAKQRLSSFRASSEQQLQLLGSISSAKGTLDIKNNLDSTVGSTKIAAVAQSDTIIRRKLPPKPSLSIFTNGNSNGIVTKLEVNNNSSNSNSCKQQPQIQSKPKPQTTAIIKADFKADLDAKIRKQKEKLLQHEQQQQQQQREQSQYNNEQQQSSTKNQSITQSSASNIHLSNNCNENTVKRSSSSNINPLPLPSKKTNHLDSYTTLPIVNATNNNHCCNNTNNKMPQQNGGLVHASNSLHHYHQSQTHSKQSSASHTVHVQTNTNHLPSNVVMSTASISASSLVTPTPIVMPVPASMPVPVHVSASSNSISAPHHVFSSAAATVSATCSVTTLKPSITPRPASLSGGITRIARRSSVNTSKPPPPVRRSSSVTPSPNVANAGSQVQQPQQQHLHPPANSNLLHQQQNSLNNSTESLPPPPPYLLHDRRQSQSTPASPPTVMPNSSLKVAETVKALSAMKHQPASPTALRHQMQHNQLQQQPRIQSPNQHNLYSTTTLSATMIRDESDYEVHCNTYVDVNAYTVDSSTHASMLTNCQQKISLAAYQQQELYQQQLEQQQQHYNSPKHIQQQYGYSPSTLFRSNSALEHYALNPTSPPPLPPIPNANQRLTHYQQHQLNSQQNHTQQQQLNQAQQHYYSSNEAIYGNNSSFRTSSPGIYAQPKIVSNMSSFRSSPSPGPNGHHIHQPQAQQPKTNPNLIAQLNARLGKQQTNSNEGLYGSTPSLQNHHNQQQNESNYMRNYAQQAAAQQQQQHHEDYASTNLEKTNSIRLSTKAEFLENLNAKLAKQGMSGRAFAVRNLINSKALPDPRICHESLMDQIKRGATLKRNQKINDRSAPKIL